MKVFKQLYLLIILACFLSLQINAQTNSNSSANVQAENNSGLDVKDINQKLHHSLVQIKSRWQLINNDNGKPVYLLFVSKEQLAKAGIKVSTDEAAVPVYVKTDTGYEPILVENQGEHNVPFVALGSGSGFFATEDGYILTTRRIVSPWHSTFEMNLVDTPGILMSADLKQVLETNVPAPKNWIPSKTKPRRGTLGKLNITVNSTGKYTGKYESLNVSNFQGLDRVKAIPVMVSNDQELGILKINVPGKLTRLEFSGNSDALRKGAENIYVVHVNLSEKSPALNLEVMEKMSLEDFKKAQFWAVTPTFISGIQRIENSGDVMLLKNSLSAAEGARASELQNHFAFYSGGYSGSPVFDGQGRLIGIYLAYDRETDSHRVVPIHLAEKLMAGK